MDDVLTASTDWLLGAACFQRSRARLVSAAVRGTLAHKELARALRAWTACGQERRRAVRLLGRAVRSMLGTQLRRGVNAWLSLVAERRATALLVGELVRVQEAVVELSA